MFLIEVAGVVVEVRNRCRYIKRLCRDYITTGKRADFSVRAEGWELKAERANAPTPPGPFARGYLESNCLYRKICLNMIDYGGFLMHAAVIETGGGAIAFAAKSGVGKSTHIRLWRRQFGDSVRVLNGDKPLIRRIDGRFCACGTPWRGKEQKGCNAIAPLKALCFLERGEENRIERLTPAQAIPRLFHQVLMPKEPERMERFLALVEEMLDSTPCWLLHCDMTPEAAETARRGLLGGD